jgi:hypothetical protein
VLFLGRITHKHTLLSAASAILSNNKFGGIIVFKTPPTNCGKSGALYTISPGLQLKWLDFNTKENFQKDLVLRD